MGNKRWSCGIEGHPGINAPGRMRRNDWRRVCVPCSEASGWISYRVCVSAERKRQKKAEKKAAENRISVAERAVQRAADRAKRLSAKEIRAASWEMCGTNIRDIYKTLGQQFSMKREALGGTRQPEFNLAGGGVGRGWSNEQKAYTLWVPPGCSRAKVEVEIAQRFACRFDFPLAGQHLLRVAENCWDISVEDLGKPAQMNSKTGQVENYWGVVYGCVKVLEDRSGVPGSDPKWLLPACANLVAGTGRWKGVDVSSIVGKDWFQNMDGDEAVAMDLWLEATPLETA